MKNICKHVHCEYHYFEDVLKSIKETDDVNIIVGAIHENQFSEETFSFLQEGKRNILIQVSEESEDPYNLHYDKFDMIFRTYNTNSKFDGIKVFPIPCGPVTLLRFNWHKSERPSIDSNTPLNQRRNDLFFSGQSNEERIHCVNNLNRIKDQYNSYVSLTKMFVDGLRLQDYYNILSDTKISIVPMGVCINESFRFFESVFCNNIIITSLNFKSEKFNKIWYYEDCPAIIIDDWNEISYEMIDKILLRLNEYEEKNRRYYENKISPNAVANFICEKIKTLK